MIGTQTYASIVESLPTHFDVFDDSTGDYLHTPEGFKFLGAGGYRIAFLGPDNVVYKIEYDHGGHTNQRECERFETHDVEAAAAHFVRFAACSLYGTVLAMEYLQGDDSTVDTKTARQYMRDAFNYFDCADFKRGENWHGQGGMMVLTDYSY